MIAELHNNQRVHKTALHVAGDAPIVRKLNMILPDKISANIANDLASSASSYFKMGISAFFESRKDTWTNFQPAIGNLSISVELLLKSIVASRSFSLLFVGLPDELNLYLNYPNSVAKSFSIDKYLGDLNSFNYKTVEIDKSIALFYLMFPEGKTRFRKFLSNISRLRNQSVHGAIPDFRKYELERLAYLSINLFLFVEEKKVHNRFYFNTDEKINKFVKHYEDEKVTKVKKAVEAAQERFKSGSVKRETIGLDEWSALVVECPICGSDGICEGETEHEFDSGELYLTFLADSFNCDACELILEDYDELVLAGMKTDYERDEDRNKWIYENDGDPNHPYY